MSAGPVFLDTRRRRIALIGLVVVASTVVILSLYSPHRHLLRHRFQEYKEVLGQTKPVQKKPKHLPEPDWVPPPVKDPFPSLATGPPPPIPAWNVARQGLHEEYGLAYAPPLLIGFTRGWPMLLQAVVSYITSGWPADQIYVVENTGTQWANPRGGLSLQNPFYLSHELLGKLRVNVIQTPVLLSFAQLQNFYVHVAHEKKWPQYFWSHMDVVALSWEDGDEGRGPRAGEEGYRTLYENAVAELGDTLRSGERWATRFFAYDAFTLVNRVAYDEVGGWDANIPYYMTDCDMHSRLEMHNWTLADRSAGIISDVSSVLDDLRVLYRDPSAELAFTDPNPAPPEKRTDPDEGHADGEEERSRAATETNRRPGHSADRVAYWQRVRETVREMDRLKHGGRGRNTWQEAQRGGQGEPYYYPSRGVQVAFDMLTEAGRRIFAEKWGHENCELITKAGLKLEDQWRVAHDWD